VREELIPATMREANEIWEQICETNGVPDDDSRALAKAMLEHQAQFAKTPRQKARAKRGVEFSYAFSRYLIGDKYADALDLPKTSWRFSFRAIRLFVNSAESIRRTVPGSDAVLLRLGEKYWADAVKMRIENAAAVTFAMPEKLGAA
jgi:hypothetical protein